MSATTTGDPKRPPCGGWHVYSLFATQYRPSANGIPQFTNATKIQSPDCLPAYQLPDCADTQCWQNCYPPNCGSSGVPPCPCAAGETYEQGNCYTPAGTKENFATCKKQGFKNAKAWKVWHGAFGWNSHDRQTMFNRLDDPWPQYGPYVSIFEELQPSPDQTKFLTVDTGTVTVTSKTVNMDDGSVTGDITGTGQRKYSVGRTTGNVAATVNDTVTVNVSGPNTKGTTPQAVQELLNLAYQLATGDQSSCQAILPLFWQLVSSIDFNYYDYDPDTGEPVYTGHAPPPIVTSSNNGRHWEYHAHIWQGDDATGLLVESESCVVDFDAHTVEHYQYGQELVTNAWIALVHEKLTFGNTSFAYSKKIESYDTGIQGLSVATCPPLTADQLAAMQKAGQTSTNALHLTKTVDFTAILEDAYNAGTASDAPSAGTLYGDAKYLLSQYDFADDVKNPWRMDTLTNAAPQLHFDEASMPVSPMGQNTDPAAVFTSPMTGVVIGTPTPPGYAPFYQYRHEGSIYGGTDEYGRPIWTRHYGEFAPGWCVHCSGWTNEREIEQNASGAFVRGGPNGVLELQKWAEVLLFAKPSHNFARPCGTDKTLEQDQFRACSNGARPLRWPSAPCYCDEPTNTVCHGETPGSLNKWNDITKKGDFVTRLLSYNNRAFMDAQRVHDASVARAASNASNPPNDAWHFDSQLPPIGDVPVPAGPLTGIDVADRCGSYVPCHPVVVTCTPNNDDGDISLAFPSPQMDQRYGALAYADVRQWMTDPLWQPPAIPCGDEDEYVVMREDVTGSCGTDPSLPTTVGEGLYTIRYYSRRYEEARATLPKIDGVTAPALPSSCVLGPYRDEPSFPSVTGARSFAPWAYWAKQLATGCQDGSVNGSVDPVIDDTL